MSQSLASIVVHVIFSTKARQPVLMPEIRNDLFSYIAAIAKNESAIVYEIGGVDDHVHVMLSLPRTMPLARLVELIKKESSKWLKRRHTSLQLFSWQNGYGAFSVSASKIPVVRKYIREQEQHHRRQNFQDELLAFLNTAGLLFDEKYLWD
jgi:putative transposase